MAERFPNTVIWRKYDEEFRRAKPTKPWYLWHEVNQVVLDSVCEEHRAWLKHNRQNSQSQGQKQGHEQTQAKPKQKRGDFPNNGTCHKWNNRDCTRQNCPYKHVCANCQKAGHKFAECRKPKANAQS
ncbi:MAG: hypothetical protein GY774_39350 [Planctomycetes bacterium]|nr:hypothetical protein [Planctomycetota bacterium]